MDTCRTKSQISIRNSVNRIRRFPRATTVPVAGTLSCCPSFSPSWLPRLCPARSHDFDQNPRNKFQSRHVSNQKVSSGSQTWYGCGGVHNIQEERRRGGEEPETHILRYYYGFDSLPPSSRQTSFLRPSTAWREVACGFCMLSKIPAGEIGLRGV